MAGKRVSKIELEKRIFKIQGWIIDGVSDSLIKRQAKLEWDVSARQIKRYIQAAYEAWKQDGEISIEQKRAAKIAELNHRKRSLRKEFVGTPAGMQAQTNIDKEISKLTDLYPAKRTILQGDPNNPLIPRPDYKDLKNDQIKKILEIANESD